MGTDQQEDATGRAVMVFDHLDDKAIVAQLRGEATEAWCYAIQVGGQRVTGLSVDGVQEACMRLGRLGMAIREIECTMTYEDEREARFMATAGRFVVDADGKEVLLDTAIRAKRQPKIMQLRSGQTRLDEHWYEKGVAKAVRNAAEALLPQRAKDAILAEAFAGGRVAAPPRRADAPLSPQERAQAQNEARAGNPPPPATNGGVAAPTGDSARQATRLINIARGRLDRESFRALMERGRDAFPDGFAANGNPAPGLLTEPRAAELVIWLDQEIPPNDEDVDATDAAE